MALIDKKLTDLTEKLSVPDDAFIHIVDVSDTSQSPDGSSYKARKSTISGTVKAQTGVSGTVKTNSNNADPVVYLKSEVDALILGKQDGIGFTPENVINKQTNLDEDLSGLKYPNVTAVLNGLSNKASLADLFLKADKSSTYTKAEVDNIISSLEFQDVIEAGSFSLLPLVGESEKIYITLDTNLLYRFNGTIYVPLSADISGKENTANKQNSLAVDGTGVKYPTVDAINTSTVNFNPKTTKIALLGDSITLGVGSTTGTTSYADILNSFFGFQTYTKLGFSSMTVKPTSPRPKLSDKISLIPAGTNYITLMIGINDWAENNVVGDVNAVMAKTYASLDQNLSFAEAFRYNLETIKNNFPDAEIRVITPIKHDATWVRTLDFKFYVEAEIAIANFLSIPVINAFDASGIYKSSTAQYIPDGIHPNDAGYAVIASVVKKGLIEKNTNHFSNTSFNQKLFGKPEFVSLSGNSEILRITGVGHVSGTDYVGGFSIGNFFNNTGQRAAYFGGSDSTRRLVLNDNIINGYNFSTNAYDSMQLSSSGKKVTIGNTIGPGSLLNIGNFGFSASNILLGLFGGTGQSGDYIRAENVSGVPLLRLTSTGKLLINTNVNNGVDDIQTPNTVTFAAGTTANQGVIKSQLDLKADLAGPTFTGTLSGQVGNFSGAFQANSLAISGGTASQFLKANGTVDATVYAPLASPALTGTPTAPTATAGTNTTQIATTAFVGSAITTADSGNVKTTGDQTATGRKTFNSDNTTLGGISINNNRNTKVGNYGNDAGIYIANQNTGQGISVDNHNIGKGITIGNFNTGDGLSVNNFGTGVGIDLRKQGSSTGDLLNAEVGVTRIQSTGRLSTTLAPVSGNDVVNKTYVDTKGDAKSARFELSADINLPISTVGSVSVVDFDTSVFNNSTSLFTNNGSGVITCTSAGIYLVTTSVVLESPLATALTRTDIGIRKNGTTIVAATTNDSTLALGNNVRSMTTTTIINLAANDTIATVVNLFGADATGRSIRLPSLFGTTATQVSNISIQKLEL